MIPCLKTFSIYVIHINTKPYGTVKTTNHAKMTVNQTKFTTISCKMYLLLKIQYNSACDVLMFLFPDVIIWPCLHCHLFTLSSHICQFHTHCIHFYTFPFNNRHVIHARFFFSRIIMKVNFPCI